MPLLHAGPLVLATLLPQPVARAGGLEVGAGYRQAFSPIDDPGLVEGPRAVVRFLGAEDGLALETSVFYRLNPELRSSLAQTLVQIAHMGNSSVHFQQPFTTDRLTVSIGADWAPVPRDPGARASGGPHLLGGLTVARVQDYVGVYNEAFDSGTSQEVMSVEEGEDRVALRLRTGLALDAWYLGRVGVRGSWMADWGWEEEIQYDPDQEVTGMRMDPNGLFALDLLFAWGGP